MADQSRTPAAPRHGKPSLFVIFTTVFMDLVGFGMILPLIAIYGKDLGAGGWKLAILGASYSLMQFFFAPFWGRLSDRAGRRPILLMSLTGSTLSYLGFGLATLAHSYWFLLFTRAFQGVFAANISTAQAYVSDITTRENRAKGMGMIGAAFGLGFILGPFLGGVAEFISLAAPGFLAGAICGANALLAAWRLPESLPAEARERNRAGQGPFSYDPLNLQRIRKAAEHPYLPLLLAIIFLQIFAFSNLEQVFALFFQQKFHFDLVQAGAKTGYVLAWVGLLGALFQGGLIRKIVPRFGERRLLMAGLFLFALTAAVLPFGPTYGSYFLIFIPMALGRSFIDPNTSSLVSKSVDASETGSALGLSQGLSSLARAFGPFVGLMAFQAHPDLPFFIAAAVCLLVFLLSIRLFRRTRGLGLDVAN